MWLYRSWVGLLRTGHCGHHSFTGSPELRADSMACNNTRTERDRNSGVSRKLKPECQDPKRRKVQRGEPNIWHQFFFFPPGIWKLSHVGQEAEMLYRKQLKSRTGYVLPRHLKMEFRTWKHKGPLQTPQGLSSNYWRIILYR